EMDVDHLALVLADDEGDAGGELAALGHLPGVQADPGPLRAPAAQADAEDRLPVAEEAERERVVRVDQGGPRPGRGGRGQRQEDGQGCQPESRCFLGHAGLLRGKVRPVRGRCRYATPRLSQWPLAVPGIYRWSGRRVA